MCPFCYIGKRRFEAALDTFAEKDTIDIEWKSFQLNPDLETQPGKSVYQSLAEQKGITYEQSVAMHKNVVQMAASAGLVYNFDTAVVANSFKAHRLTHFAKSLGKQSETEELLFRSYFTEGKNIDDTDSLVAIGAAAGLNESEVREVLNSDKFADDVFRDIYEARQVGVRGVPFFVFNNKYAVSGAQESRVFSEVLAKSFEEWKAETAASE